MIHIFIDFEMNSIAKELFDKIENCHMEIIEIGAVAIDDDFNELGIYKRYIKPQYNEHIMPRYVALTGIDDKTVADAEDFSEAFFDFLGWCGSFNGPDGYKIYSWSRCDRDQLKRELKQKKVFGRSRANVKWMLGHWCDYQKEFSELLGINHPISLEKAVIFLDDGFIGQMHDALCDARNTARIFIAAQDKESFNKRAQEILEILKKEEAKADDDDLSGNSIGELGEAVNLDSVL